MKQKLLKLEELEHCPLRQWAFPSEGVRCCYYQTMAKLQTGSVTQLHGTVYLWLLDEAGGALWPKPASPWLVPAPSLTEPLEATGWALAVLASLLDDLGGCQILEVTYWGACAAPAGLGDRDYKAVRKWGISLVTAGVEEQTQFQPQMGLEITMTVQMKSWLILIVHWLIAA